MDCDYLCPYPQKLKMGKSVFARPSRVSISAPAGLSHEVSMLREDLKHLAAIGVDSRATFRIRLALTRNASGPEAYTLKLGKNGATVSAGSNTGVFYGIQTLMQIFVLGDARALPSLQIDDWPAYRRRSFMVDMGRAVFTMELLKRTVRMMARLKMNLLHVHLLDDELCSLRFKTLPFGRENRHAITLEQFKALVEYGRRYHVAVMPEIECWGHVSSLIYHRRDLFGASGPLGGKSFGIGEEMFDLLGKIFDEIVPVLEPECLVHVGLDEAKWALLPTVKQEDRDKFSPAGLVGRIHGLLEEAGRRHGRKIEMHLWADHGGRPVPEELKDRVVVEPWRYFERDAEFILAALKKYGGAGKQRFMMGAGISNVHFHGHYGATRIWCQEGRKYPNIEGVTLCMWESNDLAGKLITLYAGADFAWSPDTPAKSAASSRPDPVLEALDFEITVRMRNWQVKFKDGDSDYINHDRGPEVYKGFYCWGGLAGRPVAPTVDFNLAEGGMDFAGAEV